MWTAFHANDAPAFAEQISLIKDTSFLSNSPNPVPCQAAKKGQLDILKGKSARADPALRSMPGSETHSGLISVHCGG
eukprot:1598399-Rhodomonas_salina.8